MCARYMLAGRKVPLYFRSNSIYTCTYICIERVWRYRVYRVYRIIEDLWVLQGLGIVGFRGLGLGHEI